jgi:hypothetical protein
MLPRVCLVLLLVLAVGVAAGWAAEPCQFVVIGDTRTDGSGGDVITPAPMYCRAIDEINLLQPEFVVNVGDLVLGYTDLNTLVQQWEAFDGATGKFEVPVYLAAGNHDIWDETSEKVYQERYGPLWYSFDVKHCHLIVLDSEDESPRVKIAGRQLAWLKADLSSAKGKRIFVFLHKPLWADDYTAAGSNWVRDVHPLLAEAGVDTVFAGHWHHYEDMGTSDGVRYVVTGGGGAEIGTEPVRGGFYHYVWVTVPPAGEDKAQLAIVRTGNVERQDVVTTGLRDAWAQVTSQLDAGAVLLRTEETIVKRALLLQNPFDTPLAATLEFDRVPGWSVVPERREIVLAPQGAAELQFTITASRGEMEDNLTYWFRLSAAGSGELEGRRAVTAKEPVAVECRQKPGVKIDGSLGEWGGDPTISVDREDQVVLRPRLWGGPELCSGVAWLGCDAENLYVAVRITDPDLKPKPETGHVANGDSFEIYLDGRPEADLAKGEYSEGVAYLVMIPALDGQATRIVYAEEQFTELAGIELASRQTADGYEAEVAIPLSNFPSRGELIGFDLAINDNSDPAGRLQLLWHGTIDNWEDASGFGLVRLASD